MMKPKRLQNPTSSSSSITSPENNSTMSRLAKGEKAKIDKKEMLKLTKKNYSELPEVKLAKETKQKKDEYKKRMARIKENEAMRRQMIKSRKL